MIVRSGWIYYLINIIWKIRTNLWSSRVTYSFYLPYVTLASLFRSRRLNDLFNKVNVKHNILIFKFVSNKSVLFLIFFKKIKEFKFNLFDNLKKKISNM